MNVKALVAAATALSIVSAVPASAQVAFSGDGLYGNFYSSGEPLRQAADTLALGYAPVAERGLGREPAALTERRPASDADASQTWRGNGSANGSAHRHAPARTPLTTGPR